MVANGVTYYDLPAPAKLNLFLHVVGQRADGYHLIESVFQLVSISDSISLELRSDGVISRDSDMLCDVAVEDDLVVKAARLLQQQTATRLGVHVMVRKRIPTGGGLGGGSSDAATVLIGLNRMWRTGLRRSELMQLGVQLGADVPFFLLGQAAFVSGIGEQMLPIATPLMSYLVFQPGCAVPTAAIFKDPDLTRDTEPVKISDFPGRHRYVGAAGFGRNDLELVTRRRFPMVDQSMRWVSDQGLQVRLSGSGCCFFAEAESPVQAQLARAGLVAKMTASEQSSRIFDALVNIIACDGLPRHPLAGWIED